MTNSIVLLYQGKPMLQQPIRGTQIRIGSEKDNDLIIESTTLRDQRLILKRDPTGRWHSLLETGSGHHRESRLIPGKQFSFGELAVQWKGPASTAQEPQPSKLIGTAETIHMLRQRIETLAPLNAPLLIEGESGTGKELVAEELHTLSGKQHAPFITVNCGALSPSMVEDVFFGHEKGSFTGAGTTHRGVFEQADGGTLFLDEIGELPMSHQASLLRIIDTRKVCRLGGEQQRRVNLRLITATNRNLKQMVTDGTFRLDLYHRISTLSIRTPPLRSRREDIPLMANFFLREFADEMGEKTIGPEALERLLSHSWPGNCRELRNVLYRAAALSRETVLHHQDLEISIEIPIRSTAGVSGDDIMNALTQSCGNVSRAARILGIPRTTLRNRLKHRARMVISDAVEPNRNAPVGTNTPE
jgi:two-component system, NtrC family, response regulator HydG